MHKRLGGLVIGGLVALSVLSACGAAAPTATAVPTATATKAPPTATTATAPPAAKAIAVREAWARPAMMGPTSSSFPAMGTPSTSSSAPAMSAAPLMSSAPAMSGTPGGMMGSGLNTSAAYMTISNTGGTADKLIGAAAPVAAAIELHTTEVKDNIAQMRQVQGIDVPANGEVQLKPGGFHIMLINVQRDLKPGDTFTLTLTFAQAGKVDVTVQVRQP